MGFVAKAVSKRQVAPQSGPVNTGIPGELPWLTNQYVVIGALLRSACLGLSVAGVKSITQRGRTSSIFTPAFRSSLWCETVSATRWRFYLGAIGPNEQIAADWVLELSVHEGVATVATPKYLTRDGKLEHGDLHSDLREQLLHALAFGAPDAGSIEAEASEAALSRATGTQRPVPSAAGGAIAIRTRLALPDTAQVLSRVGLPVISWSPESWRWGLGLQPRSGSDWVALRAAPQTSGTELRGELSLDGAAPVTHRRVAHAAARTWLQRAEFVLRQKDPSVAFDGPSLGAKGE